MMRRLAALLALLLPAFAVGAERFPPPEFTTGYQFPTTTTPPPRAELFAALDVVALLVALGLAAYLVHGRRSRHGLVALAVGSLLYFGFYRHGCVCAIGSIQNVALALGNPGYALPVTVAVYFLLPLAVALFAGRLFCAAVCPQGAAQELVLIRPLRVPGWLEQVLGLLPYLYLGVAVLFAALGSRFLICAYDPFVAFYRLSGSLPMLLFGGGLLLLGTVVGRPYCRFLCPYGALLRLVAPLARGPVSIFPPAKPCIQCRLCEDACPYGALHPPTPPEPVGARREGLGRLVRVLVLLPVLLALGGWLGHQSAGLLSRGDATVRLANRLWLEDHGGVPDAYARLEAFFAPPLQMADAEKAFKRLGQSREDLFRDAAALRLRFATGGTLLGLWVALVIGVLLLRLSVRRTRTIYEADPARCVGCARCYRACPLDPAYQGPAVAAEERTKVINR